MSNSYQVSVQVDLTDKKYHKDLKEIELDEIKFKTKLENAPDESVRWSGRSDGTMQWLNLSLPSF